MTEEMDRILRKIDEISKLSDEDVAGILGSEVQGIEEFNLWGLPVGESIVSGMAATMSSELINEFMKTPRIIRWLHFIIRRIPSKRLKAKWDKKIQGYVCRRGLVKLGMAAVTPKITALGPAGQRALSLLLTFDAIQDLAPLDSWADQLEQKVSEGAEDAGS